MKYVPKLIPDHLKVLPDYFKGSAYGSASSNKLLIILSYIGASFFFLSALATIGYPPLALLYGMLGLILLPPGHRWLERTFRFRLTPKIKTVFGVLFFVVSLPLLNNYQKLVTQEAAQLKQREENEEKERLAAEKKEQQRKDSINYYIQSAAALQKTLRLDNALSMLSYASALTPNSNETAEIEQARKHILVQKTIALVKNGQYKIALPALDSFLTESPNDNQLLYFRAVCNSKTGKIQEAVDDLKLAIDQGNVEAEKLHNKINPIRKRIIGYTTLCCDGTTSNARGRGACSWHGGVCNWNEPVYEEYRKY